MVKGKIIQVNEDGTAIIKANINTYDLIKKNISECYVDFIDSRPLSEKQRKMCYALINAIAEWSGSSTHEIKEAFKLEFWADKVDTLADKIFSLSNAPMSLVAEFQKFLITFILDNGVPVKKPLLEYVDDIEHYLYMCLIHKKCFICGRKAELHHVDFVGMGNNRNEIIHEGRECLPLCRDHHQEYHNIGKTEFFPKYHIDKGIAIDKTIVKLYHLRSK